MSESNKEKWVKAHELRNTGLSVREACKQANIKPATYAYYKTLENKKGQAAVSFTTLTQSKTRKLYTKKEKQGSKLAVVIGDAEDVREFLRSW